METSYFVSALEQSGIDFFTGVPDSLLSAFCNEIVSRYGIGGGRHIVAHNEGGGVALASGYYLATGKIPCVYMQNSGIGNALNPVASLTHPKVYAIPMLFVVGWRGEPGTKDEPQHVFQGEVTLELLADMDVEYVIIGESTTYEQLHTALSRFKELFEQGKSAAFVIRKNAFSDRDHAYTNAYALNREHAVEIVAKAAGNDPVVSTTGKISRELFEIRQKLGCGHEKDFLTVGSMGHSAMIALGIALQQPYRRVWCLDGDGAVLMHMGSLGIVASEAPGNFIHVVFNNAAHETVGGMPTAAGAMDLAAIALACGYSRAFKAEDPQALQEVLEENKKLCGPVFIEIYVALGSRSDLGRPTVESRENKNAFMRFLTETGSSE